MLMHPVAWDDRFAGKAYDLAKLQHRLAGRDEPGGKLVTARHTAHDADALRSRGADIEIGKSHRNIVGWIEHQRGRAWADHGFGHGGTFRDGLNFALRRPGLPPE